MDELLHDTGWHLLSDDPERGVRKYGTVVMIDGKFRLVVKTENYAIGLILDANAHARAATAGQRWGEGQRVASIPTEIWDKHLGEAHRLGDDKYLDKWLNDSEHAGLRTFEANL